MRRTGSRSNSPSAPDAGGRRFVAAADHLSGVRLHPAGHSLAVETRGKCYSMALWEGAVRQHGAADGVRHSHGQWLADGQTMVAVSDARAKSVEVFDAEAAR